MLRAFCVAEYFYEAGLKVVKVDTKRGKETKASKNDRREGKEE